jgi:hypothetical protein
VKIGSVITEAKAGAAKGLAPLPHVNPDEMQSLVLPPDEDEQPAPPALRIVK